MKRLILLILICLQIFLAAQEKKIISLPGEITYLSSQNVYIRFNDTSPLTVGDTLFVGNSEDYLPVFIVRFTSAASCAGEPLPGFICKVGDTFDFILYKELQKSKIEISSSIDTTEISPGSIDEPEVVASTGRNFSIDGKFSVSSYSNFSNIHGAEDYQRWRYSLSIDSQNLGIPGLSFETYTNFSYRADEWSSNQTSLSDRLKIYSLALGYKINDSYRVSIGRKVNPKLSNIGAVDGFQFEAVFGKFSGGIVLGSRPDYYSYGYNGKLFEVGAYIQRADTVNSSLMQNSISVFQQTNNFKTDRRFIYFQHSNNILRDFYLFISTEADIYKREEGKDKNTFGLTSFYVSGRYSPIKWASISASYDARKNVIYYETFKSFADSILETETRQGLRVGLNLRPLNLLFIRFQYGYRFKNSDIRSSNNFGTVITYSRIPLLESSLTAAFNQINTNYLKGNIYGLSLSKDLFKSAVNLTAGYRHVDYTYLNSNYKLEQNIISADISLRLFRKDYISISYEGVFEKVSSYGRIYLNLTKRF